MPAKQQAYRVRFFVGLDGSDGALRDVIVWDAFQGDAPVDVYRGDNWVARGALPYDLWLTAGGVNGRAVREAVTRAWARFMAAAPVTPSIPAPVPGPAESSP